MKIAVTTEGKNIFQHFGHCKTFTIVEVEDGVVKGKELLNPECSGHAEMVKLMADIGVKVVICGGIGASAINALGEYGILVIPGCEGAVNEAVAKFMVGEPQGMANFTCGHSHEGEHSCGSGCGSCGSCH